MRKGSAGKIPLGEMPIHDIPFNNVAIDIVGPFPRAKGFKGGLVHISRKLYIFFVTSHNFFSLSSVQIIIIPACCLLCVL